MWELVYVSIRSTYNFILLFFNSWKLVIHAAINGYSRQPVYCYCSSNNEAQTVLSLFVNAIESFGLPSRVRCDRGGENSLVGYYMLNHPLRGIGRGSIISGRSVHNQRIERFWRDLFAGYTSLFYHLFYHLEDTGLLNSDDPVHLWCLHLIYRPYINSAIANFIDGWSCHPMSSANGLSPRQLWVQGMLRNYNSGYRVTDEIYGDQADDYVSIIIAYIYL